MPEMPDLVMPEVDFALDPLPDLHERLHRLREIGPAVPVTFFGSPAWVLTRYADVAAAFRDDARLPSAAAYSIFAEPVQGRTLQCMEGEEHRVNRALVSPAFRQSAVTRSIDPLLAPIAHELVDSLRPRGEVDLVAEFAHRYPFMVITRLLGLPRSAEEDFFRWADALFSFPSDPQGALDAAAEFTRYLTPVVAARRSAPGDDLLSLLATYEVEGQRLTDEEIFSFVRLLFPAGADTTYLGLGSLLVAVLGHLDGDQRQRVVSDEAYRKAAVEESLRWEPPVALQPRRSVAETTWGDVVVPAESWVLFGIAAANRDPAAFPEGDRFDPSRFLPGGSSPSKPSSPSLTFGFGTHYCLGAYLARAEMAVVLEVLLSRLPGLRLADPDVEIVNAVLHGPKEVVCRWDA